MILFFSLSVNLTMKRIRVSQLYISKIAEWWPKLPGKKIASISYNHVQKVMILYYYVYHEFCKPKCINKILHQFIINYIY